MRLNQIKTWKENNYNNILECLENKRYTNLFVEFCRATNLSSVKLAAYFKCSRKSLNRYLSGKRQVPFGIINIMLKEMDIDIKNISKPEENIEFNENGTFLWYGKENILFNTLFAYRTKKMNWTRFQAACKLDINEETLKQYENGKKRISSSDIMKILEIYDIKLNELFPALVSYDGDKTFIPLCPLIDLTIEGKTYDLVEKELYCNSNDTEILYWPHFPIPRYDSTGKLLFNCVEDELTLDEYMNTEVLVFEKEDSTFYEPELSDKKLPPVYEHILNIGKIKKKKKSYKGYHYIASNCNFLNGHKVELQIKTRKNTFDLSDYVNSDSIWYSMLRNPEYFVKGRLGYIGENIPENQCIVWPDGQYVRIIELYIDKYPLRNFTYEASYGSYGGKYNNWTVYECTYIKRLLGE